MIAWLACALAQEMLSVPVGQVVLVEPPEVPTAVAIDHPEAIRVATMPPYLMVSGLAAGGGHVVPIKASPVAIAVDGGVLVPVPPDMTAHHIIRPNVVQVSPFGAEWLWIQGERTGSTDVVVERSDGLPDIHRVVVGKVGPLPAGAHPIDASYTVPVGGELLITLPSSPVGQIVGHPSRLAVTASDGSDATLRLEGKKKGQTWLLTGHADGQARLLSVLVE